MPRPDLQRLLRPQSVAVVGASEKRSRSNHAVQSLLQSSLEVFLVNPKQASSYGRGTFASLRAIGKAVDVVFVMVNAALAVEVVREAAACGAGGAIVNAGGFRETGAPGAQLEQALIEAAGDMPLLGPNCNGFLDVNRGLRLSGAPPLPIRAGSIGLVTHSGAFIGSMGAAGYERQVGFSHLVSTGNEATVDVTDCLEFLIDDPATKVVLLIVETIRRPGAFFDAARRAQRAGKPIIALKLGRSERGQALARSHTGAIAGDSAAYEWAFRQHGIAAAGDLTELADRAILFDQLPPERWSALRGLCVISPSGGGAGLASDLCARSGIELPELADVGKRLAELIPGTKVANPVDLTGFVVGNETLARTVLDLYLAAPGVDTVLLQWFVHDAGLEMGEAFLKSYEALAQSTSKTMVLGALEDTAIGSWAAALPSKGIAVTRGLPGTLRALQTMGAFVSARGAAQDRSAGGPRPIPAPAKSDRAGPMLVFPAAMKLLQAAGIPVAPFHIVRSLEDLATIPDTFSTRMALKLADVPHRTDLGAVRLSIPRSGVRAAAQELFELAKAHGLPPTIVVQPQIEAEGEAFVGIQGDSGLGPMVLCGLGGIFVELLRRVSGALAPLSAADAARIVDDVVVPVRGERPWDGGELARIVMAAGQLALDTAGWLESLDINPLLWTGSRFVAVDALCICRDIG